MRSGAQLALAALVASTLAGCVRLQYQRDVVERKPERDLVEPLAVGRTTLGDVLRVLGAPIDVWEGGDGGTAITYGGLRAKEWTVDVSVPLTDYTSASLTYTDTRARTQGYLFLFDASDVLEIVREGNLADLRQIYARRRASSVGEDDELGKRVDGTPDEKKDETP